jgi:hypothetical protein
MSEQAHQPVAPSPAEAAGAGGGGGWRAVKQVFIFVQ